MFTVTDDQILPTTTTGSWPRPGWYKNRKGNMPLSTRMTDARYREEFLDAVTTVVSDQERAGLDIITNGDYHLDPDFAGRSWHHYPVDHWDGLSGDRRSVADAGIFSDTPGSLLNEIFTGWRYPDVIGPVRARDALEFDKLWRIAQSRTDKPVKIGTISAQTIAEVLPLATSDYASDRRQLTLDIADLMNVELRRLEAAGCKVIQVEEPSIHPRAAASPDDADQIDFLIDAFNREIAGLDRAEIWAHTCWGNPNMQKAYAETSYEHSLDAYLNRANLDVLTLEAKADGMRVLELLGQYRDSLRPKIALGVVSHRSLQVETPEEVAESIRAALKYVPLEKLILTSDCGYGRDGANRNIAFYKTVATVRGANIIRQELGLPLRRVPAAEPALQVDIPRSDGP